MFMSDIVVSEPVAFSEDYQDWRELMDLINFERDMEERSEGELRQWVQHMEQDFGEAHL